MGDRLRSSYDNLPSYVKESPKFAKFLRAVGEYIYGGALAFEEFKNAFLNKEPTGIVVELLANQSGIFMDVPFLNGTPNWQEYYARMGLAYRARSFTSGFDGTLAGFVAGDTLKDVCTFSVMDFSVSKDNKQPMSVIYSLLSIKSYLTEDLVSDYLIPKIKSYLTEDLVSDYLIPKITGVGHALYFLQLGDEVFGFNRDDRTGMRIGADHVNEEPIQDAKYLVSSVQISVAGTGYLVDDVLIANGVEFKLVNTSVGAFALLTNASTEYNSDKTGENVSVTGGWGSGMKVNIIGMSTKGYFVRGFDKGKFYSITGRG